MFLSSPNELDTQNIFSIPLITQSTLAGSYKQAYVENLFSAEFHVVLASQSTKTVSQHRAQLLLTFAYVASTRFFGERDGGIFIVIFEKRVPRKLRT